MIPNHLRLRERLRIIPSCVRDRLSVHDHIVVVALALPRTLGGLRTGFESLLAIGDRGDWEVHVPFYEFEDVGVGDGGAGDGDAGVHLAELLWTGWVCGRLQMRVALWDWANYPSHAKRKKSRKDEGTVGYMSDADFLAAEA